MLQRISQTLLYEARELFRLISQELKNESWIGYERYLWCYNDLLQKAHNKGACRNLMPIEAVPKRARGTTHSLSLPEKTKLIEIAHESLTLYETLKDAYDRASSAEPAKNIDWAMSRVQQLCDRFHWTANRLGYEYHGKKIGPITDEYDVQWLFRGMLFLEFDDVRDEEWTPSYGGGSARMDFLIQPYGIVLETKMTRESLTDKKIGENLMVDIVRYQKHPYCKTLVCFVYDPDSRLKNASGLEKDIENMSTKKFPVKVIVYPRIT